MKTELRGLLTFPKPGVDLEVAGPDFRGSGSDTGEHHPDVPWHVEDWCWFIEKGMPCWGEHCGFEGYENTHFILVSFADAADWRANNTSKKELWIYFRNRAEWREAYAFARWAVTREPGVDLTEWPLKLPLSVKFLGTNELTEFERRAA